MEKQGILTIYYKPFFDMDENPFEDAVVSLLNGVATKTDEKIIKERIRNLTDDVQKFKKQLDKNKKNFLKQRDLLRNKIHQLQSDINDLRTLLKKKQPQE